MSAFEELGVQPELIRAVEEMGWNLPTPVQAEAIPLILGGGDVLAAAETGSGKTGAFALPLLQIVHETLRERAALAAAGKPVRAAPSGGAAAGSTPADVRMSVDDRDMGCAVSPDGLVAQSRDERAWAGCRATVGLVRGRFYFEATVRDEGLCRVGWSTIAAKLDLGTCPQGYGFGGTGKRSTKRKFETYGEAFGQDDVVGCLLDLESQEIAFTKNGVDLGRAFKLQGHKGHGFYPAVVLKNAEMGFRFAPPFVHAPPPGFIGVAEAQPQDTTLSGAGGGAAAGSSVSGSSGKLPLAFILEPSRELAEQTYENVVKFSKYLPKGTVPRTVCLVGGVPPKTQIQELKAGADVVVGTPGRVADFVETGKCDLSNVNFFVLDEADRLLDTGNQETILKMYQRIPKSDRRLQTLLFSATLHAPEITALADRICKHPTWVDLKGKDAVPDTVVHACVHVDPTGQHAASYLQAVPRIATDGVHKGDRVDLSQLQGKKAVESVSEAVKVMKAQVLRKIIDANQMTQCMIFVRTKVDADNLERFFVDLSDGKRFRAGQISGVEAEYSCVVLHGDRFADERRRNLAAFKNGEARFLIATDVAARGIDISELPFVINYTLPDRAEDYVHRIGRVGRADHMGLAISLVSDHKEKVWYHSCASRGKKCSDTRLKSKGGCCIWYDELQLLRDIEQRIQQGVEKLEGDLRYGDGNVTFGAKKAKEGDAVKFESHANILRPTVTELALLETQVQGSYLSMKTRFKVAK